MTSKHRTTPQTRSRDEIVKRALRAAHAVTVSAVVFAGCGPDTPSQEGENNGWDPGEPTGDMDGSSDEPDMMTPVIDMASPVEDMGASVEDMPPGKIDMSQIDMGSVAPDMKTSTPDMSTSEPDMKMSAPDMKTSEPDMPPPLMCDGQASDTVCPGFCTVNEDVDCCEALETPDKTCKLDRIRGACAS